MSFNASYIPYQLTGAFSKIVTDYLEDATGLKPFYEYRPDIQGIRDAIAARKKYSINRALLAEEMLAQYASIQTSEAVQKNIQSLEKETTFTICTAHQPNIFTGHLYFIYKIIHAIKLADELNTDMPGLHFVPVYFMGSEDADLEELGEVFINGKTYQWKTDQKGAVGRMKIDRSFIAMIGEIEAQLGVEQFGQEIMKQVKTCYSTDKTIEQATFEFVHALFMDKGLLVFLPDKAAYKRVFNYVSRKELLEQFSHKLVQETIGQFPATYKVQAGGREINLFYLKDNTRERINLVNDQYQVNNTEISFTQAGILEELETYPERFSPNVILRPLFQEMLLPNIAFIGGGGEIAYWLELKKIFDNLSVPFPVLLLRNSFMLLDKKSNTSLTRLQLHAVDFFRSAQDIFTAIVQRESKLSLHLGEEEKQLADLYEQVAAKASKIDNTLHQHVQALHQQAAKKIKKLEQKMMKAEKKKFEAMLHQVNLVKQVLYPGGQLQERIDNLLPYYAVYGKEFLEMLYNFSSGLKQEFCIVEETVN